MSVKRILQLTSTSLKSTNARLDYSPKKVVCALHGYCFGDDVSAMQRTQAKAYPLAGRVKVYESTFNVNITEELFLE